MYSSKNKNKLCAIIFLLLVTTSCSNKQCCQDSVEIPCQWHTPYEKGITDDPVDSDWWCSLGDEQLTDLIQEAICKNIDIHLACTQETVNAVIGDTAKSYLEFRGLQQRLGIVQKNIEVQNQIMQLEEGLSENFISEYELNEGKKNLDVLLAQKALLELSINKVIFHLSTLLGSPPGEMNDRIYMICTTPRLPCEVPVGYPCEFLQRHKAVQDAKKQYASSGNQLAYYNYKKQLLGALEETENALAHFYYSLEKVSFVENSKRIKEESYQLIRDLHTQGFRGEKDLLIAQQELLTQQSLLVEAKTELLISYVNLQQVLRTSICQ